MKNLVIVLIIIVCGINYAHAQSSIKVRLSDNSPFNVAVDGRYPREEVERALVSQVEIVAEREGLG